jgi:hypothetical protein
MKKFLSKISTSTVGLAAFLVSGSCMAGLPIGTPPPQTSWTITYQSPNQSSSAQMKPVSPEHAAALELHLRMVPQLVKSEAQRIGDEFVKNDFYSNKMQLQTYITPQMFIEEKRSGDEIIASNRVVYEILERGTTFLFFPELEQFDKAEPQGEITRGKFKGMLKFVIKSTEMEEHKKMVADNMREQGIVTDIDAEDITEQYIILDPKTNLPVAFFNGSVTALYEYSPAKKKLELTPSVLNLKSRLENP